jgi:hypothetical protein
VFLLFVRLELLADHLLVVFGSVTFQLLRKPLLFVHLLFLIQGRSCSRSENEVISYIFRLDF